MSRGERRYNWELREGDVIRSQPSGRLVILLRDASKEYIVDGLEYVRFPVRTIDMPLGKWTEELPSRRRHKVF